jgi:hypothetical protein
MCGIPDWLKTRARSVACVVRRERVRLQPAKNVLSRPADMGNAPPPPPAPPDMTDEEVQKARAAMVRRQLMGQGMASTFLTGPLGDLTSAPILKQSAGGM